MTLLTSAEAKHEQCPFFRYCYNETQVIQDGVGPIYIHDRCGGQDCKMGWRWYDKPSVSRAERRGYCGMAGKPEVMEL